MIKLNCNIFDLAYIQLLKEKKQITLSNIVEYAIYIRKKLDIIERNKKVAINRYKKYKKSCFGV